MVALISQVVDYMGKLGRQEMAREAVSQARGYNYKHKYKYKYKYKYKLKYKHEHKYE